jgi:hypothetical protein
MPRVPGWGCAPSGRRAGRPRRPPRRVDIVQRQRGVEDEPRRDGGHQRTGRLDENRDGAALRRALQAVPGGGGCPAQDALGAAAHIQDHHGVIAVAHEDVGHRKSLRGRLAAHPHEVAQHVVRHGLGRKAVRPVDERHPLPGVPGGGQKPCDHRLAPAARRGRDELRQPPRRQAAPEGVIDRTDGGGHPAARLAGSFRKARGKERPQRRDGWGGSGHLRSSHDGEETQPFRAGKNSLATISLVV